MAGKQDSLVGPASGMFFTSPAEKGGARVSLLT